MDFLEAAAAKITFGLERVAGWIQLSAAIILGTTIEEREEKNIAKGTMDLGIDCFDLFWMYCILCIFCIASYAYFAYGEQYLCTTPFWCKYFTTFVTFSITARASRSEKNFCLRTKETRVNKVVNIWSSKYLSIFDQINILSAHQGNKGHQTSQYLIKLFHLRILSNSSPPFINSNTRYTCIGECINIVFKTEAFCNPFRLCPGPNRRWTAHK